jgi:diacylglycerol kinase (ATP)
MASVPALATTSERKAAALKRALLLLNPKAGGGRAAGLRADIERTLRAGGLELQVFSSHATGSIREWLAAAALEEFAAVIAAGGDGTLFETLNGLLAHPRESRPPLGVLPIGTGNAFARDLGLQPGDWQRACALIARSEERYFDVGRVDCAGGPHFFLNVAGMGFVVDAGLTARKLKRIGRASYTLAALLQTGRLPSHPLRMEADSQPIEQDNLFVEISNSRYTGTSFLMAPLAKLDDGLLDLTLVRKLPRSRLLRLFPTIYSGAHVDYPEVTTLQGRHFTILEPRGYRMMIDGEFAGSIPAEISCLPGELRLIC